MNAIPLFIVLALLSSCAAPPKVIQDKEIQGFGGVKLGETLADAKAALEHDGIFYKFTGRALDYESVANGERWYISAELTKTRISSILLVTRPYIPGMSQIVVPFTECDRRFDNALETLRKEYGDDPRDASPDGSGTTDYTWFLKNRSVTLRRHKSDEGCDSLSILYADNAIADHL